MQQTNFIMALRSEEAKFLDTHPIENHLLNVIARRARRTPCSLTGLNVGECFLGHKGVGLSEQQYRTAKKNLQKWELVEFKKGQRVTDRGTVARLADIRVYDINEVEGNGTTNGLLTEDQRKGNGRVTTNNNGNKDNNGNNATKEIVIKGKDVSSPIDYSSLEMTEFEVMELKRIRGLNPKTKAITQRVVTGLAKEMKGIRSLGITNDEILTEWETRGWMSIKLEYFEKNNNHRTGTKEKADFSYGNQSQPERIINQPPQQLISNGDVNL